MIEVAIVPPRVAKRLDRVAIALIDFVTVAFWAGVLVALVFAGLLALVSIGVYVVAYI